jgi:putative RNA 2'-phosphotransferase
VNKEKDSDIKLGRFISLILRHHPEAIGIKLDEHGWADVDELIIGINKSRNKIDMETLERIVRENKKKRYSFNENHTKIRANQGHSVKVDVELKEAVPTDILYHGTAARFLNSIKENGIIKQTRQQVHLSADKETAVSVGKRHGKPIVLSIDTIKMREDGYKFYISENGVWLCNDIPWKYIINNKSTQQ